MKILMTGATGLIGKELGKALAFKGHELIVITRNPLKARETLPFPCELITGDLSQGPITHALFEQIDVVINLMGESVAGDRWTEEKKHKIWDSRIKATQNLLKRFCPNQQSQEKNF